MALYESPRSARSSTSSQVSQLSHPLTPVYELGSSDEMAIISSSSGSSNNDDEEEEVNRRDFNQHHPPSLSTKQISPQVPSSSFSFGTCPSEALNRTPTSELGPFDYPLPSPASTSYTLPYYPPGSPTNRKQSLALGMTHRRRSIISRNNSPVEHSSSKFPSPPSTRRSSTCSTITTLPAAGNRPSILHSASTTSGAPIPPLPLYSPPNQPRRSSLLFPQKQLATPIPPSLLARRGSLPLSQLLNRNDNLGGLIGGRASISGQGMSNVTTGGWTTTTAQLYKRRESMGSEGGGSESSGKTANAGGGIPRRDSADQPRRGSMIPGSRIDMEGLRISQNSQPRRMSLPHTTSSGSDDSISSQTTVIPDQHRKHRKSSLATSSLSLSEEEEEAEEEENEAKAGAIVESKTGTFEGFTDPWATQKKAESVNESGRVDGCAGTTEEGQ